MTTKTLNEDVHMNNKILFYTFFGKNKVSNTYICNASFTCRREFIRALLLKETTEFIEQ